MTSTTVDHDDLPERPESADTWYEVLDVPRGARGEGLEKAYRRAIALVDGQRLGGYFLLDPEAIAAAKKEIEAAYAVLSDPQRRREYDRSLDGDDHPLIHPLIQSEADPFPSPQRETISGTRSDPNRTPSVRILSPVEDATTPPASVSSPPTAAVSQPPTPATSSTTPPPTTTTTLPSTSTTPTSSKVSEVTGKVAVRRGGIAFAMPKTDIGEPLASSEGRPGPRPIDEPEGVASAIPRPVSVSRTETPTPPPGLFNLEGEVNGQLLRRLREARHLTIDELSEATKIRKVYLRAIEDVDIENLPGRVFLRGFLTQIARVLRVDKVGLADGYLAFVVRFYDRS